MNFKARVIAFYLPQFHPFKENDEWWGKGFTEWTNVGKAKPLFKGHNQPRVPTELGYYDLRLPSIRKQQADLAKEFGVEGFCYWHYWFGNGKRLMEDIFDDVLKSGSPDLPFCLGWANHSWYNKTWNPDGTASKELLMEQTYPGLDDEHQHFNYLLAAFKDERYIKVNGAPLLYIFDPGSLPHEYIDNFRKWTKLSGFPDLYIVANISGNQNVKEKYLNMGYSAVTYVRLAGMISRRFAQHKFTNPFFYAMKLKRVYNFIKRRPPFMTDYEKFIPEMITEEEKENNVIPCIVPQWDHTPRSGWNGSLFVNTSPDLFFTHVRTALEAIKDKPNEEKLIFLKSWNEWGEGNFIEPDITFGRGFLEALRKAICSFSDK